MMADECWRQWRKMADECCLVVEETDRASAKLFDLEVTQYLFYSIYLSYHC